MTHNEKSADDFERQLTQSLRNASPYIPDDGFALALMQKLPEARKNYTPSKPLLIIGSLIVLLVVMVGLSTFIEPVVQWIYTLKLAAVIHLGLWMLAIMIAGVLGWLGRRMELL